MWDGAKRPDSIPWRGDITVNKEYENNVLRIKYWIDNGNHMNDAWLMSSTVKGKHVIITIIRLSQPVSFLLSSLRSSG